ncbi:MAG: hypothetical protein ACN4GW_09035 [Desulforhopalus sp.]
MTFPIRSTLLFGILSSIAVLPLTKFLTVFVGWYMGSKIYILLNLAFYSFMLCRWTKSRMISLVYPLLLAAGMTLWSNDISSFVVVILWVFAWIRSGICFQSILSRKVVAELITLVGGAGFLLFWWPGITVTLPVATWFFFLVQTLYFLIIPLEDEERESAGPDQFERARQEMERIFRVSDIS